MNIKINLLKPYSDLIGKKNIQIEFSGKNLKELLDVLVDRYPKLKKEFFSEDDVLTDYICIFVNDKPISALNGLETILKNDDQIIFFIPMSGG